MTEAWPTVRLGAVTALVQRPEVPLPGITYRQIGVKLWGEGAYEREVVDGSQTKYGQLFRAEADDIIVNKIWARNGSVAVVPPSLAGCYGSGEFPMFAPNRERLDSRWIHWLTKTRGFWSQCDEKSQGTSGKNRIRPERFLDIEVPLPPLAEQQRVVARIEELAGQITEARGLRHESVEEVQALFEQGRATVFIAAAKACVTTLEQLATLERGKFSHRPRNEPRFFGGSHPWIQIAEIERSNKFIQEWSTTLNDDGLAISKKFPKGTVLISIAATIGATGILAFDCCVPDSIVGITPRTGTDSEFLYHYLGYVRTHLESIAPQSAQKNINLQILGPLPAPKIPLHEQRKIVAYLDDLQAQVDALTQLHAEAAAELDALLPTILDRAFKGELV
jgi:type I restriction enzyme S subunit